MMNRRQFILTSGVIASSTVLAGCTSKKGDKPTSSETNDKNNVNKSLPKIVNIKNAKGDQKGKDKPAPLKYDISALKVDHKEEPYKFKIKITNDSKEPVKFGDLQSSFFYNSTSNDFVLVPDKWANQNVYKYIKNKEVWLLTEGMAMEMTYDTMTIKPGESISRTLVLLHKVLIGDSTVSEYPKELTFSTDISWNIKTSPNLIPQGTVSFTIDMDPTQ